MSDKKKLTAEEQQILEGKAILESMDTDWRKRFYDTETAEKKSYRHNEEKKVKKPTVKRKRITKNKERINKKDLGKKSLRELAKYNNPDIAREIKQGVRDVSGKQNIRTHRRWTQSGETELEGKRRDRTKAKRKSARGYVEEAQKQYGIKLQQSIEARDLKYAMAHPGKRGRPENGNRQRERLAGKERKLQRHVQHVQNYIDTHPIHDIPVSVNGVTQMVPTSHRYLEGMEINNGAVTKQAFSYKGFKEYEYTPKQGMKTVSKAFTNDFTSGLKEAPSKQQTNEGFGGFHAGALANMQQGIQTIKKVTDFDKKFGGKK